MPTVNPNMIILAREARSMSQGEVASLLGISHSRLSKIENGLLTATEYEIKTLSGILKYPELFFYEEGERYPLQMNYYRKYKGISKKLLSQINAIISIIRVHVLDKLLNSIEIVQDKIINYDLDEDNFDTPEDIALAIRSYWNIPSGRIDNVVKTLEDAGIIIIPYDFPTRKFSGVSIMSKHGYWAILVNQNLPADRIRFTLVHELGHIIMHRFPSATMEEEADRFASEFLIPSQDISSQLRGLTLEKLAYLKLNWKVSMASLLRKAYTLNKITENQYRYLNALMAKAGFKINEPAQYNVPYEKPSLLEKIIMVHLTDLNYSISGLNKIVNLYKNEFSQIHQIEEIEQKVIETPQRPDEHINTGLKLVELTNAG